MNRLSFRAKLTIIFLITAMIESMLIGALSYTHSRDIVVRNKKGEMADTINRIDININVRVRNIMEMMDTAASSQTIRNACILGYGDNDRAFGRNYLEDYCNNLTRSMGPKTEVAVLKNSRVMYTTSDRGEGLEQVTAEQEQAYHTAINGRYDKAVWVGITDQLFDHGEGRQVVSVVRAVTDSRSGRVLGLLVVELDPDMFSNLLLNNQGLFEYQYLFILDQKGDVICSNPKVNFNWSETINGMFEQGIRKFDLEWQGKQYYVCGQYNGVTGWKSYSAIPEAGLFPQAKDLWKSILVVVVMCTLAVAVIIMVISFAMTRPIKRLSGAMVQVQEGDFTVQVPNWRKDEIGELTESFNYMVNKINNLIKQVYQEKIAQKNAEVQALQAQINPHFLYNTLDSINWMLIDKGEYEISDIVISLGSLMRYSIEDESAFVTLNREVEYVLSYLKIQKNRLEDRLEYAIAVDEGIGEEKIPKLILQPLVENAITHGIEPHKGKGIVRIEAREAGTDIVITVSDNGIGMTPEQLRHLGEEEPDLEKEGHTGIGLRNVDRRLRLHYGEDYRIQIQSSYKKGTVIALRIPREDHKLRETLGDDLQRRTP